jgi:pimeloyl-ACP methyl ester carboxylesterase
VLTEPFRRDGLMLAVGAVGEGRPLMLQHGLRGDAAQTAEIVPVGGGWQSLTLECRGHGSSDSGPYDALSLATFAEDLGAFIEARLRPPVPVGGISMGAALALRLAVMQPDLVSALILIRPAWGCDDAPPNLAPYALCGDLLARHPPEEALAVFDVTAIARRLGEEAPDNLASLRAILLSEPTEVTRALLARIAADGPGVTRAQLARLGLPALVIGQDRDHAHPLALATELATLIPGARLVQVPPKAESRDRHREGVRQALASSFQELP